jgi:DNA-directed RNA polymerase beta subunit
MEKVIDFTRTRPARDIPDLLGIQRESYKEFLDKKMGDILEKLFPIETKKIKLEYMGYHVGEPVRSIEDCLRVGSTYEARVTARFRLIYLDTGEMKEQEVYLADVPLMTPEGCFIINGRKRVVVEQLIRSPGVFFQTEKDKATGILNYVVTIIPDRGNWMDMEVGKDNVIYVRLKKKLKKLPLTLVLKVIGFKDNEEIKQHFQRNMTLNILTTSTFSYDFALGKILIENILDEEGKIVAKKGEEFTEEIAEKLRSKGIEKITVKVKGIDYWIEQTLKRDRTEKPEEAMIEIYKVLHPKERPTLEAAEQLVHTLLKDPMRNEYSPVARYKINKKFNRKSKSRVLEKQDFIDIINYLIDIREGLKQTDDIDNLSNRRVRTVGELIAEEFERGVVRVQRSARDRITITQKENLKLSDIISARTISGQLRQFSGTNQLSQFMEETNPLASLAHKRRLSSLGPGGLHRKRAGIEVRDIHYSHYSRICPIETPEGQNIGLINSLATYARVNEYGFITAPYRIVKKGRVTNEIVELTADEEEKYIIAQANTEVDKRGEIKEDFVIARERSESGEILPRLVPKEKVDLMDIVPQQVIGVSASLIPFLDHDDANRALMGCNMQRQAVPLLNPDAPRVATGIEKRIPIDNLDVPVAQENGIVSYVSGSEIHIVPDNAKTESVSVYREAHDLRVNLQNKIKQKEILLFGFEPIVKAYEKYIGEKLAPTTLDKLISRGIENISIIQADKLQKFPIMSCFELEKNEALIGKISADTILSKRGKPVIEAGQKISDTKLNRLFNSKVKEIKIRENEEIISEPVFSIALTAVGKNIIGKGLFATYTNTKRNVEITYPITENLLKGLYEKGITDLVIYYPSEVETFSLGKLNTDVIDRVSAKDYAVKSGKKKVVVVKNGEIIDWQKLRTLAESGVKKVELRKEKVYKLKKFVRTNQDTCRNERPLVHKGQRVKSGDPIADGYSTKNAELALGINVLVAYVPWYGYNYQDAVIVSRRLVSEDRLTSIHVKEYNVEVHDTEHGPEELTPDPPDVSREAKRFLDENGIVKIGSKVKSGDILVGKTTPFPEEEETSEARLFRNLFNNRAGNIKNSSFKVPPGEGGIVIGVNVFSQEEGYELTKNVRKLIKIFIAKKRKIIVGDKVSGRHGNKGVISKILPEEDLPYLDDGTMVDVILSPLSVPSRMNIGQILETNIGLAARKLNVKVITPAFNGATEKDVKKLLKKSGLPESGQFTMYDGRTGKPFDYPVTLGESYLLKLNHLAEDKLHARSVGKYTLITQQPVGGKAQFGGQRLGEMEVWALEAYGAANLLQEMLTIKSDDLEGRKRTYEQISKGNTVLEMGIPESFNVLQRELRGLVLDLRVLPERKKEVPKEEKFSIIKKKPELIIKEETDDGKRNK